MPVTWSKGVVRLKGTNFGFAPNVLRQLIPRMDYYMKGTIFKHTSASVFLFQRKTPPPSPLLERNVLVSPEEKSTPKIKPEESVADTPKYHSQCLHLVSQHIIEP